MFKESPDNWEPSTDDLKAAEELMRQLDVENMLPTEEHIGIERARETVRVESLAEKRQQLREKLVDFYAHLSTTPPDFAFREHLGLLHTAMQKLAEDPKGTDADRAAREYEVEQLVETVLRNLRKGGGPLRDGLIEPEFRTWRGPRPKDALDDHVDLCTRDLVGGVRQLQLRRAIGHARRPRVLSSK